MVAKITISGAIGGNPGPPSSAWAAAAVAADELVVIALKASQELAGVDVTRVAAAGGAGVAAMAAVGTAQRDSATAAAVILRPKADIIFAPAEGCTPLIPPGSNSKAQRD
jgi:hypothetical protein